MFNDFARLNDNRKPEIQCRTLIQGSKKIKRENMNIILHKIVA